MTPEMEDQPTGSEMSEQPTDSATGAPTSPEPSEPAAPRMEEPTSAEPTNSMALAIPEGELPAVKLPSTVRLHSGEQVVLALRPSKWWTWPRYLFTLGLWYFWRKRHVYVLSNERVLVVKGIINTSEASAPLARIQDLHVRRSILSGGRVEWSTAGGQMGVTKIANVTRNDAVLLADAMTPLIGRDQRATP